MLVVVDEGTPGPTGRSRWPTGDPSSAWAGDPPATWPDLSPHDPVAVVWTSGTTGHPKGAVFDHANLAAVADGTDVLSDTGDRRHSPLPLRTSAT